MSGQWDVLEGLRGPTPGAPQVRAARQDTFVTYRPLSNCRFCQKQIDEEMEEDNYQPPDTERVCPHVRKLEFDQLLARNVRGEVIDLRLNTTVLPSGVVQITAFWCEVETPKGQAESRRPSRL